MAVFKRQPGCCCGGITCELCDGNNAPESLLVAIASVGTYKTGCMSTECGDLWNKTHTLTNGNPAACQTNTGACGELWNVHYDDVDGYVQSTVIPPYTCQAGTGFWDCLSVSASLVLSAGDYKLTVAIAMCRATDSKPCDANPFGAVFQKDFGTSIPACTAWSSLSVPLISNTDLIGTVNACNFGSATCSVTSN